MRKETVEGAVNKSVGSIKQAVGKAVGNKSLEAEGVADKVVGQVQQAVGASKDAAEKALDKARAALDSKKI